MLNTLSRRGPEWEPNRDVVCNVRVPSYTMMQNKTKNTQTEINMLSTNGLYVYIVYKLMYVGCAGVFLYGSRGGGLKKKSLYASSLGTI